MSISHVDEAALADLRTNKKFRLNPNYTANPRGK